MKENTVTITAVEQGNCFSRLLSEFREGESQAELSEQLQEVVAAVRDTGKPGKLTYTIIVKPSGNAIVVTDEIKTKVPQMPRDASIFFATDQNTLQRENPNQKRLDLRTVERPVQEVKEAPKMTAAVAS
jgi:hypothetical protein